jgi:hypothetical protein
VLFPAPGGAFTISVLFLSSKDNTSGMTSTTGSCMSEKLNGKLK